MITIKEKSEERKFEIECNNCSCLLEYQRSDIGYGAIYRGSDYHNTIRCPNCDELIVVKQKSIRLTNRKGIR